jgi:hypothetical protein
VNPRSSIEVTEGIKAYMDRHGVKDLAELVGAVKIEG